MITINFFGTDVQLHWSRFMATKCISHAVSKIKYMSYPKHSQPTTFYLKYWHSWNYNYTMLLLCIQLFEYKIAVLVKFGKYTKVHKKYTSIIFLLWIMNVQPGEGLKVQSTCPFVNQHPWNIYQKLYRYKLFHNLYK